MAEEDPQGVLGRLIERLVTATHAREHKLFAGKLDSRTLRPTERLPVKLARCREGDWRDMNAVDDWAAAIAHELSDTATLDPRQ